MVVPGVARLDLSDRTAEGLKPRFVKAEPPRDADVADIVRKISRRVIRKLRQLEYLEAGRETAVPPDMIRCSTTNPISLALWPPPSSSESPLGNGLESRYGGLARVLAPKGKVLHSKDPAVPV